VIDKGGNIAVDFIGRFENLQASFDEICDRIEVPRLALPVLNKIDRPHYSTFYDEETRDRVAEDCHKEIEVLGYEFGKDE